jgi:hypothetical protein
MKLHTLDEFLEDIERFEVCDVNGHNLGIVNSGIRFLKLYSEYFEQKLGVDNWHENTAKRTNGMFSDPNVLLPPCDIYPSSEKAFYVYRVKWTPSKLLREAELTLLSTEDTNEDAVKYFESEHETQICIVSTQTDEVMYFDRNMH